MRHLTSVLLISAVLLAAAASAQQPGPKNLKDQLTGDANGAASSNPQCRLFTRAEISAYAGAALGSGENAGGGMGCMWTSADYESSAMVSVVPPRYLPEPTLVKGFKRLPAVGTKGWVAPDSGWSAGTMVGDEGLLVVISGTKASEASAVALLKEVIKRRHK